MQKIIADLSELIGSGDAWQIVRRWAGSELYVPRHMTRDHPIALTIGLEKAQILSKRYGNDRIRIPIERNALREQRNQSILKAKDDGKSYTQISRDHGLSRPAVVAIIRKLRDNEEREAA